MVLRLTFKSFIHLEFIFVYGISWWLNFIFVPVPVQISQHHLLKRLFLLHFVFCPLFWILIDHRDMGLFLGSLFCSLDLCVCSYASSRLFWLQWPCNTLCYQVLWSLLLCSSSSKLLQLFGVVYGSIKISECLFYICEICHGYFTRDCIESIIALGSMAILMMLILPIHEHGACFHLFVSSLIFSLVLCSFLSTGHLSLWFSLFLGTLFFLLLYQMGLFSWFLFW